jgi:hypothetical protein
VTIVQAGLPENNGSVPGGGRHLSVHHAFIPDVGPFNDLSNGSGGIYPVAKRSGRETYHTPPTSTEITNA